MVLDEKHLPFLGPLAFNDFHPISVIIFWSFHYKEFLPFTQISHILITVTCSSSPNLLFSTSVLRSLCHLYSLFLPLSSHVIFSPIMTTTQTSSVPLLQKSLILSVLLLAMPSKLLNVTDQYLIAFFVPSHRILRAVAWCYYKCMFFNFIQSSNIP